MTERGILFSGAMVRALLDGTKTQTRRAVKMPPSWDCIVYADWGNGWWPYRSDDGESPSYDNNEIPLNCPYGQPGDRLWVKETYRFPDSFDADCPSIVGERCLDAGYSKPWAPIQYEADGMRRDWIHVGTPPHATAQPTAGKGRPSIHMPRWASRILLEIVSVRVEPLRDISEADARAEGVTIEARHTIGYCAGEFLPPAIRAYRDLWEQINGTGSWDANPWVWVVEFRRVEE